MFRVGRFSVVLTLAVLITSHSRKAKTLECIRRVYNQEGRDAFCVKVYLVDDGSTDGTADAVRVQFPEATVLNGSGSLYWNGGMRLAFAHAMSKGFDFYLLLNDDTRLLPDATAKLLHTYRQVTTGAGADAIIVGSTFDSTTGRMSYGGMCSVSQFSPMDVRKIPPSNAPQRCDTINGNCVLIPHIVAATMGNLDPAFTHAMGDMDYGYRAKKAGCSLWIAPGYVGECVLNTGRGFWTDRSLSVRERWCRLLGPKGLPPREWFVFTSRHAGPLWPLYWLNPYLKFWRGALGEVIKRSLRRIVRG
jgi:GT2 family glycosyltransferase